MTPMYSLITGDGQASVTVLFLDQGPQVAHSDHPNFKAIVAVLADATENDTPVDEAALYDLFDLSVAVSKRFEKLSERVAVKNGTIYLDGDPVDTALTQQVVRFLDEGVEDWKPLVAFFEKVQANSNDHSRRQLYDWLRNREGITLTAEGDLVGYKGVALDGDVFVSIHSGSAIVDGEPVTGRIPNRIGSVVEMPRTSVHHDPRSACSHGLHVGTYRYAQSYAQGAMLEVHVNPRDVVSVPNDASGEKVRVCRYKVVRTLDAPYATAVLTDEADPDEGDADWEVTCDECGEALGTVSERNFIERNGRDFCDADCADDFYLED